MFKYNSTYLCLKRHDKFNNLYKETIKSYLWYENISKYTLRL